MNCTCTRCKSYLEKVIKGRETCKDCGEGMKKSILESGLLEEEITSGLDDVLDIQSAHGHNTLARNVKEFISNMDSV